MLLWDVYGGDTIVVNFVNFQVDAKFLRNQRFAKKHNLKPAEQKKRAEERKATKAESV